MDKKILLFTTIGKLSDESQAHVNASFKSWKDYGLDILVFGETFHKDLCNEFDAILDTSVEKSEFGIPLVRSLFVKASQYDGYDIICYINSDIIFDKDPRPILDQIHYKEFMAVGQRLDVWNWPTITKKKVHNPGGIDYFFMTKDFRDWNDMPDFSVARGRFDHWIMGKALESGKAVVDLTKVFLPIHPEPKNRISASPDVQYANGMVKLGYQQYRNMNIFLDLQCHGQTNMTPFIMTKKGLEKRKEIPLNEFKHQFEYDYEKF